MTTRPIPNDPSLEKLRTEAKRQRQADAAGETEALERVQEFHPRGGGARTRFLLADAQLVTARSYGFRSWAKIRQHLVEIEPFVWNPPPLPGPESRVEVFVRLA